MPKYYTRDSLQSKLEQIKRQEDVVKVTGREVGMEAGANCDWHDNFGYEDARRRLELASSMLHRLREEVSDAQVITIEEQNTRVNIGVSVKILVNGDERLLTIGAYGESDPTSGLITYASPLGRALLCMQVGDSKNTMVGDNLMEIELLEILPPSFRYRHLVSRTREGEQESADIERRQNIS